LQGNQIEAVTWQEDHIRILDQTKLPLTEDYIECRNTVEVARAIERLSVRGAPAIGVTAAMALAMECSRISVESFEELVRKLDEFSSVLLKTRPTAVNLKWALIRMRKKALTCRSGGIDSVRNTLKHEALAIYRENIDADAAIAGNGQSIIPDRATIITICMSGLSSSS